MEIARVFCTLDGRIIIVDIFGLKDNFQTLRGLGWKDFEVGGLGVKMAFRILPGPNNNEARSLSLRRRMRITLTGISRASV
jgi:hypothetical protein